ncbi:hypothetical protein LOK49_LG04G01604 [Camellia lanceoleosa]|uniref:Uncharacterized protein n=1 Tax=Camellia lanceoleosa TaxID=1840588 RepID=A0ACC0I2N6_9ERIC|nr:hypothetical protein LOK49_LG04G01604 [Camellia lanceoleosa]
MANAIGLYFLSAMAKNKKRKLVRKRPLINKIDKETTKMMKRKMVRKRPLNNKIDTEKKKMMRRKMVKNPEPENNNFEKKKQLVEKTLAAPKETKEAENDDDSEKKIQELFEPYSKDQLLDFIIHASVKDAAVLTRLRDAISHRKVFAKQPRKKIDNLIKSCWLASLDTAVSQIGQTSSASRAPGAAASFCGYYPPSHLPPDFTNVMQSDKVMHVVVPSNSGQVKHCTHNFSTSLGMGMHVDLPLCSFVVDGTWFQSNCEAGFAWVAFNEHGRRIAQDSHAFFAVSAGVVEAIASLEALKWAARQGFRNVAVSTDCLTVVKALKDETSCDDSALLNVVMEIRWLCNSFDYVVVKKVERQVVHEAHVLARAALGRTS